MQDIALADYYLIDDDRMELALEGSGRQELTCDRLYRGGLGSRQQIAGGLEARRSGGAYCCLLVAAWAAAAGRRTNQSNRNRRPTKTARHERRRSVPPLGVGGS